MRGLKDYLESVHSRGGKQQTSATAGIVLLANIPLDADRRPRLPNLFLNLPPFLRETAFIDRLHGIVPGWELPRIEEQAIAASVGFKADFFGEVLHGLRRRAGYAEYVSTQGRIVGSNAILRLAADYLKLLFPNLRPRTRNWWTIACDLRPPCARWCGTNWRRWIRSTGG